MSVGDVSQDSLYEQTADTYGSSLDRLARLNARSEVRRCPMPSRITLPPPKVISSP